MSLACETASFVWLLKKGKNGYMLGWRSGTNFLQNLISHFLSFQHHKLQCKPSVYSHNHYECSHSPSEISKSSHFHFSNPTINHLSPSTHLIWLSFFYSRIQKSHKSLSCTYFQRNKSIHLRQRQPRCPRCRGLY